MTDVFTVRLLDQFYGACNTSLTYTLARHQFMTNHLLGEGAVPAK